MPEDIVPQPDWVQATRMFDGLGELAAILSPAKRFDTRGVVLFLQDFEEGLGCAAVSLSGTGAAYEISTKCSEFGGLSLKLTGGSDGGGYAVVAWNRYKPELSKLGFEAHFYPEGTPAYIYLAMAVYDGSVAHQGVVRYDSVNEKWEYIDDEGNYQDLIDYPLVWALGYHFVPMKLVIDPENDKYVRLVLPDQDVDMSEIDLYTPASAIDPQFRSLFWVYSTAGDNDYGYLDSIVITHKEPA